MEVERVETQAHIAVVEERVASVESVWVEGQTEVVVVEELLVE